MESMSNFSFTSNPNLHFHRPLRKPQHNNNGNFKLEASQPPHYPPTRSTRFPPKKFKETNLFPNSIPIHNKNPRAIYKDIKRFSQDNKLKEALAILDYLEHSGIPVNVTTFASLINACTRAKSIEAARTVHVHVRINGLEENGFLQKKIVQMYSACGSTEDAQKVFEKMRVTSVEPWNALLRGNVVLGARNYRDVLASFMEMRASGVELNVYSFSCLIKSLAGAKAFHQGLKTHAILVKNGLLGSCIVKTSLIDLYFKCGKIRLAGELFNEIEEKDVVLWGTMIAGFAHNMLRREVLDYTRWMVCEGVEVNSVVVSTILPVIGDISARKLGQEVHAHVIKTKDYSTRVFIQTGLIDMYCKCGDMESGRKVFYRSMERSTVSWTALVSGYVASGRSEQALRSIVWMQQEGFKPDVVTVCTVLPVCGTLKALKQGKELHAFAIKYGYSSGVSISTSLMMMYSKCRSLHYCSRVFDSIEHKNVISWTAMIECFVEAQCLHEALGVFRLMQLSKHRPDSVTIARMLNICSQLKAVKLGKEIHAHALRKQLDMVPFVSAEIVKMYGKFGEINRSKLVFDAIPVKGAVTWTALIEAYGCNCQYGEAISLFRKMMLGRFSPNQFTFNVILRICKEAGLMEEAQEFFTLMTRKYKIKAFEEHYSILIDLFTRFGQTEDAEKFVQLRASFL